MKIRGGDIWTLTGGVDVLVLSSTVYNDIASEPTVIVAPIFADEPVEGFGVLIGEHRWAAPGLITSLRKERLTEYRSSVDVQALTDVNTMLFRILATPDR